MQLGKILPPLCPTTKICGNVSAYRGNPIRLRVTCGQWQMAFLLKNRKLQWFTEHRRPMPTMPAYRSQIRFNEITHKVRDELARLCALQSAVEPDRPLADMQSRNLGIAAREIHILTGMHSRNSGWRHRT